MGWAGGSDLFTRIIEVIKPEIPDNVKRKEVYKKLVDAFEDSDWDTQSECEGIDPAYDSALMELHPEWVDISD